VEPKLSKESAKWLAEITALYVVPSSQHKLLVLAASAWDETVEARRMIAEHGLVTTNSYGITHANPAIKIEREAAFSFARLVRLAGLLEVEPPASPKAPSSPRGKARKCIESGDGTKT
jgi:phage terminase small subunit